MVIKFRDLDSQLKIFSIWRLEDIIFIFLINSAAIYWRIDLYTHVLPLFSLRKLRYLVRWGFSHVYFLFKDLKFWTFSIVGFFQFQSYIIVLLEVCFLLDWFVLPMEKRSTSNTASRKMPPSKLFSKITTPDGSVESLAIDNKHLACTPNKRTPNKSGLTPIHPRKSPGTGMKHKSGLTPIHPGAHGRSKSPFFTKPLKSGLLPIRPSNVGLFFNILNYQINSKLL